MKDQKYIVQRKTGGPEYEIVSSLEAEMRARAVISLDPDFNVLPEAVKDAIAGVVIVMATAAKRGYAELLDIPAKLTYKAASEWSDEFECAVVGYDIPTEEGSLSLAGEANPTVPKE